MKLFPALAAVLVLAGAAQAQPPSHADRMRACAAEWRAKKSADSHSGVRYQAFMSDCMRQRAAAVKAPADA